MDAASQQRFDALRKEHYPKELNRIAAHLTLFHTLPASDEVRKTLVKEAEMLGNFPIRVTGVRSLGRGVAYFLEGEQLNVLHERLLQGFEPHLSAQDRQGFRPHVVVQNKVTSQEARRLLKDLSASFVSAHVEATGLCWWNYLGGPWELREMIPFASQPRN